MNYEHKKQNQHTKTKMPSKVYLAPYLGEIIEAGDVKKGDIVILRGRPVRITGISVSK